MNPTPRSLKVLAAAADGELDPEPQAVIATDRTISALAIGMSFRERVTV